MVRVGITGGIGSGKTYVCRMLEARGWPVFYCDEQARRLMQSDPTLRHALTRLIGPHAYRPDGSLHKPAIGAYLFASPAHAAKVNAIVHPRVRSEFLRWAEAQAPQPVVCIESAILRESHFDELVDVVVRVTAPAEVRLQRVTLRDALTADDVRRRIRAQADTETPPQPGELLLDNNGQTDLAPRVERLMQEIARRAAAL